MTQRMMVCLPLAASPVRARTLVTHSLLLASEGLSSGTVMALTVIFSGS